MTAEVRSENAELRIPQTLDAPNAKFKLLHSAFLLLPSPV